MVPAWGVWMTPYAELQTTSNFSFLRGAAHPEELVARAAERDLERHRDHRPQHPGRGRPSASGRP